MALISWRKLQAGMSGKGKPTEAAKTVIEQTINQITNALPATTLTAGTVRLATTAETITGTDASIAVTPSGLAGKPASETEKGIVELATTAETNTGTDAARAVTPDGLAGSNLGTAGIGVVAVGFTADVTVADGKAYMSVPAFMNGMNLIRAQAMVITAGTTNATTIDIYNVTDSQDMLSTAISIASGATVGTVGTINTSYDDVATNDVLRIDVTTASTTKPKGLLVILELRLP